MSLAIRCAIFGCAISRNVSFAIFKVTTKDDEYGTVWGEKSMMLSPQRELLTRVCKASLITALFLLVIDIILSVKCYVVNTPYYMYPVVLFSVHFLQ